MDRLPNGMIVAWNMEIGLQGMLPAGHEGSPTGFTSAAGVVPGASIFHTTIKYRTHVCRNEG